MGPVCDGGAGPQGRRTHHGFGHLGIGYASLSRSPRVDLNAVRALRGERNRECHQLFVFDGDRSLGHGGFVESPEGLHPGWSVCIHGLEFPQILHAVHGIASFFQKRYDGISTGVFRDNFLYMISTGNGTAHPLLWLDRNWLYAGVVGACFYLALLPLLKLQGSAAWLLYLQLPFYVVHQLEEHVHDRFRRYVNCTLGGGLELLTPRAVTVINVAGVWCVDLAILSLAAFAGPSYGLLAFYLAIVNGLSHIVAAIKMRAYNPGLITSALLLVPAGWAGVIAYAKIYTLSRADHVWSLFYILLLHAAIIVHILYRRGALSQERRI
jgi:hypothetical protein